MCRRIGHFLSSRFLVPLLAVGWLAAACAAQDSPYTSAGIAGTLAQPPWLSDEIYGNLTAMHRDYMQRLYFDPPSAVPGVRFFGDAGLNIVHTYFSHNPSFIHHGPGPLPEPGTFYYALNFAPRLTLGAETPSGFGVRVNWWQISEGTAPPAFGSQDPTLTNTYLSVPVFGVPGFTSPSPAAQKFKIFNDNIGFTNRVRFTDLTWDVFEQWRWEGTSLLVGGGLQYVYLSQHYQAMRWNSGSTKTPKVTLNQDMDVVESGRNFTGLGPSIVLEARHRLGDTFFTAYGTARGSVLFGHGNTQSFQQTVQNVAIGNAAPVQTSTFVQNGFRANDVVPAGDFEAGLEMDIDFDRLIFLVRLGVANQTYFGTGSATTDRGNFGFFGMRCTAGFTY